MRFYKRVNGVLVPRYLFRSILDGRAQDFTTADDAMAVLSDRHYLSDDWGATWRLALPVTRNGHTIFVG